MFRRIADYRHHNHADEDIGHAERSGGLFHGPDQNLADPRRESRRAHQHQQGIAQAPVLPGFGGFRLAFPFEKLLVRAKRKQQVRAIRDQQHEGDLQAQVMLAHPLAGTHQIVERGGHDEADGGQQQQGGLRARRRLIEFLLGVPEPARHRRRAQHQQDIADDGTRQRRLHHRIQAFSQRQNGDDQFRRIAECGIQ